MDFSCGDVMGVGSDTTAIPYSVKLNIESIRFNRKNYGSINDMRISLIITA